MNIHSTIHNVTILAPAIKGQIWEVYYHGEFVNAFPTIDQALTFRAQLLG